MGEVGYLVRPQRTSDARVVWPAMHPGFKERAVENQLVAALEQVRQTDLALGAVEYIVLLDSLPRHTASLGGQRNPGAGHFLFLHKKLLPLRFPLLGGYDWRCFHGVLGSGIELTSCSVRPRGCAGGVTIVTGFANQCRKARAHASSGISEPRASAPDPQSQS